MRLIDADALVPDIGDAEIENGTKAVHYSQKAIMDAPTVISEKRAYWGKIKTPFFPVLNTCSSCIYQIWGKNKATKYCPECGAKMDL